MTPERWQQIGQLYHAALELAPDARVAYLDGACDGDEELRREAASLLQAHQQVDGAITKKVAGALAELADRQTSLIGRSLGHYQILSLLGAGGMGEVYLARDANLGRQVAVKLLPAEYTRDAERVRRFQREARAASALNHPNILTIHEIGADAGGAHYIVSEFVAGHTLRMLLQDGRLEIRQAVAIAEQVANALNVAHEAGIVHRDIKPENVMVRPDGLVKVLDFGLAKLIETPTPAANSDASTLPKLSTEAGVVMGTAHYRSPEQARGLKVDARTDIFSLGVMLYEMVAGRRPFEGATTSEVIAAILRDEPPSLRQHCAEAPPELERITAKCLTKEREARHQSAAEVVAALKTVPPGIPQPAERSVVTHELAAVQTGETTTKMRALLRRAPVVATLAVGLLLALGVYLFRQRASEPTRSANTPPVNSVAYNEYVNGRYYTNRQNVADNDKAIRMLESAVAAEPEFAAAQAELAQAYIWKLFLFTPQDKTLEEKAFMATEKALRLDPKLGAGHLARGRLFWTPARRFPHEQAIQEYQQALALDASLDEARNQLALVYNHIGALEPALRELRIAVALNPTNSLALFRIGETLGFQGKYEEALTALRKISPDANRAKVTFHMSTALLHLNRKDEVADLVTNFLKNEREDIEGGLMIGLQAMLAALAGDEATAEARIKSALVAGEGFGHFHHTAFSVACSYALLKKKPFSTAMVASGGRRRLSQLRLI
jgi:serine/threonine protein kinase